MAASLATLALLTGLLALSHAPFGEAWIGINYGGTKFSSNPIPVEKAVSIIRSRGINAVKIFEATPQLHKALAGRDLEVCTGVPNYLLSSFARSVKNAQKWVDENIVPFVSSTNFVAIAVGNEVFQPFYNGEYNGFIIKALQNVYSALKARKLHKKIKVVCPLDASILQNTFPPSASEFRKDIKPVVKGILSFLKKTDSYFMFNCYGFFAVLSDKYFKANFYLFQNNDGVKDRGLSYTNMFDAQFDALIWAMEKVGVKNMPIVIGEIGWPTSGIDIATVSNAKIYNQNLIRKVLSSEGTPKRPGKPIKVYMFSMFDEDLKPDLPNVQGGFERHWGVYTMQGKPKYELSFVKKGSFVDLIPVYTKVATGKWCIANKAFYSKESTIRNSLSWACKSGKADCTPIAKGAKCYANGNLLYNAAYAFNSYYQNQGQKGGSCYFNNTATITTISPYIGGCVLPSPNKKWCVPKNLLLQDSFNYACGLGGADCSAIRPGKKCYNPNNLLSHASYAFNKYYQLKGKKASNCYFNGIGVLTNKNPSYSSCVYPSS